MGHKDYMRRGALGAVTATLMLAGSAAVYAQEAEQAPMVRAAEQELVVPLYKSRVVRLEAPAARVSVGNPDVADILILRSTQLYVLGKDLGTTNVLLWDRSDRLIGSVAVEVTHDLESLKAKLHELMPDEDIRIYATQRSLVLSGRVSSLVNMNAAVRVAEAYLAQVSTSVKSQQFEQQSASRREDKAVGEVINLMQVGGGQQVMLAVKVAEMDRTELRRIDAKFNSIFRGSSRWAVGGVNGGATFPDLVFTDPAGLDIGGGRLPAIGGGTPTPLGPAIDEFAPSDLFIEDKGLFATFISDDWLFNMALDVAKDKGLARVLAEPTLTTLSGQEAQFLSGGEFPIPVPQGNNNGITVEFKEFGVGLKFVPVVLGAGLINLKTNVTVSELTDANNVVIRADNTLSTFVVPALRKRSAGTTVELKDGQTIGIAGLINENLREAVQKFPGLGDLPVIGHLFRSQQFIKGETELVITVTPKLAKPIAPEDLRLPTDSFIEPSDRDFFLFGRMEGKAAAAEPAGTADNQGGTEATFGHQVN